MKTAALVFPHQLFKQNPVLRKKPEKVFLVEDTLFFHDQQYPMRMHRQKLAYHRETCTLYAEYLAKKVCVETISWTQKKSDIPTLFQQIDRDGFEHIVICDVHDYALRKRIEASADKTSLAIEWLDSPMFLNTADDNIHYRAGKKRWFMKDFYQWQRGRFDVLMDGDQPRGGKWSFDEDNRKKLPKKLLSDLPVLPAIKQSQTRSLAVTAINRQFKHGLGNIEKTYYPSTHASAERWLDQFLEQRFELFGPYEDAIVENENWLYHSVLTPMLNTGLLTPKQVLDKTLDAAELHSTPIASVEGFVRQIIGWREFMRATYEDMGVPMRTTNHWHHTRSMPDAFYTATTGIDPVDNTIERILETGYCHHIERLMVLGGFMFICEIDPDHIYRWFMEMFIDSYDWVMVPNVYAMSQHADGGSITTKPYFSGSNYIIKMSHYKKGEWSDVWDALFWRWILNNKTKLAGNHRWSMMCKNAERMDASRVKAVHTIAENFMAKL